MIRLDRRTKRLGGETYGYQISNPPYGVKWEKSKASVKAEHDEKGFSGRFGAGLPRISDGQLLFVQHMVTKMRSPEEGGGRIAVFLNLFLLCVSSHSYTISTCIVFQCYGYFAFTSIGICIPTAF